MNIDLAAGMNTRMNQCFRQGFIRFRQIHVFTHQRDFDGPLRIFQCMHQFLPGAQICRFCKNIQPVANDFIQHLVVQQTRNFVNTVYIHCQNHCLFAHVGEQRDLASLLSRQLAVRAAEQHIRLNADFAQLLYRMLGRLGFQLSRRGDIWQQGEVNEAGILARKLYRHLPDCFQKRQRFDIPDRPPDLDDGDLGIPRASLDVQFDFVSNVRNDLHCARRGNRRDALS